VTKRILNTSKNEVRPEWIMGGSPESIEDQEKRGQDQLVNSHQLPVKGIDQLVKFGITYGKPLKSDPLFCDCQLPEGWSTRPTDHSMWSKLVDSDEKVKAMIFYKAAFYDRDAFIQLYERSTDET
jgi:hypothetical protein